MSMVKKTILEDPEREAFDVNVNIRIRVKAKSELKAENRVLRIMEKGLDDILDRRNVIEAGIALTPQNPHAVKVEEN